MFDKFYDFSQQEFEIVHNSTFLNVNSCQKLKLRNVRLCSMILRHVYDTSMITCNIELIKI